MTINHNTPTLENRIMITDQLIEAKKKEIESHSTALFKCEGDLNSLMLQKNELHLLQNLKNGKWACIDTKTGDILPLNFIGGNN